MNFEKKREELKNIISNQLTPLIDNNYIHIDLPYHTNIGDLLIWKGEEDFLQSLPYKCLYKSSIETFLFPNISDSVVILLHGGGNFGDVWRRHMEFNLRIIHQYPNNRIIILPQTVHYNNNELILHDSDLFSKHKNITICARDMDSLDILNNHFSANNTLLVPDMAFCMTSIINNREKFKKSNKTLLLKRTDHELLDYDFKKFMSSSDPLDILDWPSMDRSIFSWRIYTVLKRIHFACKKVKYLNRVSASIVDWYASIIFMPKLVSMGIEYIEQYKYVYTTRLHGAILSILLQVPLSLFDNSYGKNASFYNSWLTDVDEVKFINGL